ncbi:MAG: hypothetical protein KME22_09020 [Hassallia sp. WJT32-NPBG1]|nr:hypothetical protein [Hassallia sp. WJT32-NPBG1]
MIKEALSKLKTRSIVILILVLGAFFLAIKDNSFRETFGDLAKIGVGGYLGQLLPQDKRND